MLSEKGKFLKKDVENLSPKKSDKTKEVSPQEAAIAEGTVTNKMVKEAAGLLDKRIEVFVNDYFSSKKEKISNEDREIEYVKPIKRIKKIKGNFLGGKWDGEVMAELDRLLGKKERALSSKGNKDEVDEIRQRRAMWSLTAVLRETMNAGLSKKQIEKILGKEKTEK